MIRAYTPWPGTYTTHKGQRLLVLQARALPEWQDSGEPGQVIALSAEQIAVVTGKGALHLIEIQQAGRKAMSPQAFVQGHSDLIGSTLGTSA
jgi:methionyl-tRNA formyltransferase